MPVIVYISGTPKRSHVAPHLGGIVLVALFVCGFHLPSAVAQDLPWRSLVHITDRPRMEYTPAVVPDPADARGESWYAFTPGYLWHTDDMGVTVRPLSETGRTNLMTSALAVAHQDPDQLFVATGVNGYTGPRENHRFQGDGVYRSMDRGATWSRLPFFEGVPPGSDLHVLNSIAVSALGDTLLVTTEERILRSVDRGQTWAEVHVLPILSFIWREETRTMTNAHAKLYHHPESLQNVFVTVREGARWRPEHHYALVSHDGGETWDYLRVDDEQFTRRYNPNAPNVLVGFDDISFLFAADPNDPNIFWAQVARSARATGTPPRQIFRSEDGGRTWVDVPVTQKEGADYWAGDGPALSMHVHPTSSDTLVLGYSHGLYRDGQLITAGQQGPAAIHFLIPSPSTTRGFRWMQENTNLPFDGSHPPAWRVSWTVNELGAARAFYTGDLPLMPYMYDLCTVPIEPGTDPSQRYIVDGVHWHGYRGWRVDDGQGKASGAAHSSLVEPRADARTAPVPGQPMALLPDVGWPSALPNIHCHPERDAVLTGYGFPRFPYSRDYNPYGVSSQLPDRVWVAGQFRLYRSDDYGETVEFLESYERFRGPDLRDILFVHAHDADADVIYTSHGITHDAGETWEAREIPDELRPRLQDKVLSDPESAAILYVCGITGLRKWGNYMRIQKMLAEPDEYGLCKDLLIFPDHTDRMWMGTDTGLWETLDGGRTWSRQNRGLPNVPITSVNLSHDGKEILVATFGRGLFTVPTTEADVLLVSTAPGTELPESAALLTNYPNPFAGETVLQFSTHKPAHVKLEMFDVLGRRVAIVTDQRYGSGMHQVRVEGRNIPSGVYFVRMEADGQSVGVQTIVRR